MGAMATPSSSRSSSPIPTADAHLILLCLWHGLLLGMAAPKDTYLHLIRCRLYGG